MYSCCWRCGRWGGARVALLRRGGVDGGAGPVEAEAWADDAGADAGGGRIGGQEQSADHRLLPAKTIQPDGRRDRSHACLAMREADPAAIHPAPIMQPLVSAVQLRILHAFAGEE